MAEWDKVPVRIITMMTATLSRILTVSRSLLKSLLQSVITVIQLAEFKCVNSHSPLPPHNDRLVSLAALVHHLNLQTNRGELPSLVSDLVSYNMQCICIHANVYTCIPVYLYTCIPAYLHTCIPVYLHTCIPVYLHTCIPVSLHTCKLVSYIPLCRQRED